MARGTLAYGGVRAKCTVVAGAAVIAAGPWQGSAEPYVWGTLTWCDAVARVRRTAVRVWGAAPVRLPVRHMCDRQWTQRNSSGTFVDVKCDGRGERQGGGEAMCVLARVVAHGLHVGLIEMAVCGLHAWEFTIMLLQDTVCMQDCVDEASVRPAH